MSYNARYQDIDDYDDYEEEKDSSIIPILGTIVKWFIRLGIVCAVIVAIYYLVKLQITSLLLFIVGLVIAYFFGIIEVAGFTTTVFSIWFVGGLLMMQIGIVGIYIGKVFDQVKGRPLYVVMDKVNIE